MRQIQEFESYCHKPGKVPAVGQIKIVQIVLSPYLVGNQPTSAIQQRVMEEHKCSIFHLRGAN